jgi:hypothetical protein
MTKAEIQAKLIEHILQNPLMMQQLSDRVYELLREDLRKQQERNQGYGSRL